MKYEEVEINITDNGINITKDEIRENYEAEVKCLSRILDWLEFYGFTELEIAEIMHKARRNIGIKYKNMRSEEYREEIYKRNIEKYGDKYGPTLQWLLDHGKSYKDIIESSVRPNNNYSEIRNKILQNIGKDDIND